jgi:hypothetical protein
LVPGFFAFIIVALPGSMLVNRACLCRSGVEFAVQHINLICCEWLAGEADTTPNLRHRRKPTVGVNGHGVGHASIASGYDITPPCRLSCRLSRANSGLAVAITRILSVPSLQSVLRKCVG